MIDKCDDIVDTLGCPGCDIGIGYADSRHIFPIALDVVGDDLLHTLTALLHLFDDLVIDIGIVAHKSDIVAESDKRTPQQVESDGTAGMP
ncbi:hypothetical protein D1872_306180 [compost metagenome]